MGVVSDVPVESALVALNACFGQSSEMIMDELLGSNWSRAAFRTIVSTAVLYNFKAC